MFKNSVSVWLHIPHEECVVYTVATNIRGCSFTWNEVLLIGDSYSQNTAEIV